MKYLNQIVLHTVVLGFMLVLNSCSNNPYPDQPELSNTGYSYHRSPPKNLDPQHSYTSSDLRYIYLAYEGLFTYNYYDQLKLEPLLAKSIPQEKIKRDASGNILEVRYSIELREGAHFIDEACFENGKGREIVATDFEYSFKRAADKVVNCPIASQFYFIKGFKEMREKIDQARAESIKEWEKENKRDFDKKQDFIPSKTIYAKTGPIEGIEIKGKHRFDLVMNRRYPQMLYWLAMRFICAVPVEAVDYYDDRLRDRESWAPVDFSLRPVGSGPYRIHWPDFRKDQKVVMVRNENWWGLKADTPVTRYPKEAPSKEDLEKGYWTPDVAGKPIAMMDRIEWHYDIERLTRFNKFIQGYYDVNAVPTEIANELVVGQTLSEEMQKLKIKLNQTIEMDIRYIGFNMNDDRVGSPAKFESSELEANREKTLERNKKLRQAMGLAIDFDEFIEIHMKKMAINAQTIIPPGVFGHDTKYKNPYKYQDESSLDKARKLLEEAGYKNGIDPETNEALKLEFTCSAKTASDYEMMNFYIDAWKKIGLDVKLDAMEYVQFQNKMYGDRFQIFTWGWHADYPDPENFLFLLSKQSVPNPNHAYFANDRFEKYFKLMENMTNEETVMVDEGEKGMVKMSRLDLIKKCTDVYVEESPWIIMYHTMKFTMYHDWFKNLKSHPIMTYPYHYYRIDPEARVTYRQNENKPIRWPAALIVIVIIGFILPGIKTYMKERN